MYEFGEGAGGGIGQTNRDAIRKNDFGGRRRTINHFDGNEGWRLGWRSMLLPMFLEPDLKRADGTADFTGDLGDRACAGKNLGNGGDSKIGTVTDAGHRKAG